MKTYVMSDIHGDLNSYMDILSQIDFENFNSRDKLYILGDVVDRGSSSIKILHHIINNTDKITLIMGNHDYMMLTAMDIYLASKRTQEDLETLQTSNWYVRNGGDQTFAELCTYNDEEIRKVLDFVRSLPYNKEVQVNGQKYYLVHGRPFNYKDENDSAGLKKMSARVKMVWGRFPTDTENEMDKTLIFGHTCSKYYKEFNENEHWKIVQQKNYIAIDCGIAYKESSSRLGCLRLQDKKEFYAKPI